MRGHGHRGLRGHRRRPGERQDAARLAGGADEPLHRRRHRQVDDPSGRFSFQVGPDLVPAAGDDTLHHYRLEGRGIDKATAERFHIGFAPRQADFLLRRLAKSFSSDLLVEAGLVSQGESGLRDRFRSRITFPIHDLSGRAVGFGGRVLPSADAKQAKYINTAETPVYRKGELLYNLDVSKGSVTRASEVYVVEGYTDVISLAVAGVENSVATCGTALSESHLRTLSRFAQRAVLTFDADEAGARAAERAFAFHEAVPIRPVVLILPEGQDPSDFARKNGGEAFKTLAAAARPLVDYMLRRTIERTIRYRPFASLEDFLARVDPRSQEAESLARVGAFDGLGSIPSILRRLQGGGWQAGQPFAAQV